MSDAISFIGKLAEQQNKISNQILNKQDHPKRYD